MSWTAVPAAGNGGSNITGYRVTAYNSAGTVVQRLLFNAASTTRVLTFNLVGPYTFDVAAVNAVGDGPVSAPSAPASAL